MTDRQLSERQIELQERQVLVQERISKQLAQIYLALSKKDDRPAAPGDFAILERLLPVIAETYGPGLSFTCGELIQFAETHERGGELQTCLRRLFDDASPQSIGMFFRRVEGKDAGSYRIERVKRFRGRILWCVGGL